MYLFSTEDGTMLHYDRIGKGEPVYFFHPPALGAAVFTEQTPLSEWYKLVALNARGHALSESGREPLSLKLWAEDARAIADYEQDERVVLVGYSCGGLPALEFALRFPNRVRGLVLIGGFPVVDTLLLEREFRLGVYAAEHTWQSLMSTVLSRSHTKHKEARKRMRRTVQSVPSDVLASWYRAGVEADYTNSLGQLTAPTLLVYGIHDRYVQGYQSTFYEQMKKARVDTVYIDGVGHQVPTRRSKELNAVLRSFLMNNP
ncbi:alpha/beta fold hydrolase [Geomicrobium sp. JCM 19039]|uniref:alpha/beta fold hydrolase n=1 Tax=Geomicrobium sp. JCM 19039 TaxID=1460636 RepID=UPI00045F2FA9|nr:alpha/beta hydrolase [Geomicrobium sp. JCM 19039]GAK12093.1 hydrolase [Geomicrobium sp. JCM 19039]